MKKASIFVLIAILTVLLIGCSKQEDSLTTEKQPMQSSFSAGEPSEAPAAGDEEAAAVKATEAEKPKEITNSTVLEQPIATESNSGNQHSGKTPGNEKTTAATKSESAATSKIKPPKTTKPKKAEPPAQKNPKPVKPSKPKTAYDAPYDTATIIANAKAYGEGIGMTWSEPLTKNNCSWEAPGSTSPTISGKRLKLAIESSIRRIKMLQQDNEYQPGEFHFKVTFEAAGGGEYTIYFLMG
jgi:hypothetical protein